MDSINQTSEFSADLFFNTVNAYYRTAAIKAAIELGIFDVIAEGSKTVEEIADACQASQRGIRILCYFLANIGFLSINHHEFSMTRNMVLFLCRKSPGYLGGSIDFLLSPYIMNAFLDLTSVIKTGKINLPMEGVVASDHPEWVNFARAMQPMMCLPSMLLAELADSFPNKPIKVLDIAAGHGLFGIAIAQRNPNAKIICLDWNNVLDVARENAINANVAGQVNFMPGNAFEVDYGHEYDVILMANFLHHFNSCDCEKILLKAMSALNETGRILIFEFIANDDRVSPTLASTFSMLMLGTTPAGDVYTFSELQSMFANIGYLDVELKSIPPAMERVVAAYKNINSFNKAKELGYAVLSTS